VSTGGEIEVGGFTRTRIFPFPNLVIDKERQNKKAKKARHPIKADMSVFSLADIIFHLNCNPYIIL
jgi:hypothetical protein